MIAQNIQTACIFQRLGNENAFEGLMLTLLRTLVLAFDWRQKKTIDF